MNLQCADIDALIQTFIDDELASEDQRRFEQHIADCGDCSSLVKTEIALHDQLRNALAPPPAPPELRARIQDALDREDHMNGAGRAPLRNWILPGAASVAAAAALALFIMGSNHPVGSSQSEPSSTISATGERNQTPVHPPTTLPTRPVDTTPHQSPSGVNATDSSELQIVYQVEYLGRRYDVQVLLIDGAHLHRRGAERMHIGQGRHVYAMSHGDVNELWWTTRRGEGVMFRSQMPMQGLVNSTLARLRQP